MAQNPPPDLELTSLQGQSRSLADWVTVFHLVVVGVSPYDHRSAWIVPTAARILTGYEQADCRVAWIVTGTREDAELFLGRWAHEILTFVDPDGSAVRAMGLSTLPAIVHLAHDATVVNAAEGWDPFRWRALAAELSRIVGWTAPVIPGPRDPGPFEGAPVSEVVLKPDEDAVSYNPDDPARVAEGIGSAEKVDQPAAPGTDAG